MSVLFSSRKACFCAFCKTERKLYLKKNIGWLDAFGSAMGAIVLTYALFQELDPRGVFFFLALAIAGEVFVKLRWRMNIVCHHCGFDPALYVKNPEGAAEKVKIFLQKRKEDPAMLLKPALNLPKISKELAAELKLQDERKKKTTGKIISRQV